MAEKAPVDLSPFRNMVNFAAGGHLVLAAEWGSPNNGLWHYSWIEFVDPPIGSFGHSPLFSNFELPGGEPDIEKRYGYRVLGISFSNDQIGTVHLLNLAKVLLDHPDPDRAYISFDFVTQMGSYEESKSLKLRSEVYRGTAAPVVGPYVADLPNDQEFLNKDGVNLEEGFQYRRDGLVGMTGAAETTATVFQTAHRVRFNIPVGQSTDTPVVGTP